MATAFASTAVTDLPDVILSNIVVAVSDTCSCNSAALVCWKWLLLELATCTHLILCGNIRDLFILPTCFRSVSHIDLSLLPLWGHFLLSFASNLSLLAQLLRQGDWRLGDSSVGVE
ncbi:hypothetical protein LOK49_LG11G02346 [Camellia lanceoleosa]|uniref:Uncharacterized protein n=1 Tax=Camellia lanceoleosa TaxID=1840588 RepID=A0ACC0G277_9ERIC|nr:hypothetical protein LOK49_LG11G02346 [Camellia lanceoleosa]